MSGNVTWVGPPPSPGSASLLPELPVLSSGHCQLKPASGPPAALQPRAGPAPVAVELLLDLLRELPCRCQDEGDGAVTAGQRGLGLDVQQRGQQERQGLAAAGLRPASV